MTTLQTGTKVLIEATVERPSPYNSDEFVVALKSGDTLLIKLSDLTVCETAEVDPPTPQQIEVGDVVTTKSFTNGDGFYVDDRQIKYFGREGTAVYVTEKLCQVNHGEGEPFYIWPLSAVELFHKKSEPVPTPSFKAGQEVEWQPTQGEEVEIGVHGEFVPCIYIGKAPHAYVGYDKKSGDVIYAINIRPIPAQPTVESAEEELKTILNNAYRKGEWGSYLDQEILAWHQKHSGRVEVRQPKEHEIRGRILLNMSEGLKDRDASIKACQYFLSNEYQNESNTSNPCEGK